MKFQVQLVPVTQVCLGISFALNSHFFSFGSRGVVLECGALEVCSESAGDASMSGCNLNRVAK